MSNKKRILSFLAVLLASEVLLGAFGYLTAYLQMRDTVGVLATVSYVIQQLLVNLPIFISVGVAFFCVPRRGFRALPGIIAVLLSFTFVYQTALTFLDYYFLQEYLFGASLLLGLINGLYAGIFSSAIVFALLFFIPYFLFLRDKESGAEARRYAAFSAMLILLLYGLIEETAALFAHLSENFWIIYASEILSFVLFCLLRVGVAAFGFLAILVTDRMHAKILNQGGAKS